MSDNNAVQVNTKNLDALLKALKNSPKARVGILGATDNRSKGIATSNATIGMKHEFGDDKVPRRSFLRMPIAEMMQKYLDKSGAFDKEALARVLQEKSITAWIKKIGIVGEQIIADAFDSGGFGKWKPSIMAFKNNHQTLVETQQLRNSITSEVK